MKRVFTLLSIMTLCAVVWSGNVFGEGIKGTFVKRGFKDFTIDSDGTQMYFNVGRTTTFSPKHWRPMEGDKISVEYHKKQGRSRMMLVPNVVTLEKLGPNNNNTIIESPTKVTVLEVGASGAIVVLDEYDGLEKRFLRSRRNTKIIPAGWLPQQGEKATLTFEMKNKDGRGLNIDYVMLKLEKID